MGWSANCLLPSSPQRPRFTSFKGVLGKSSATSAAATIAGQSSETMKEGKCQSTSRHLGCIGSPSERPSSIQRPLSSFPLGLPSRRRCPNHCGRDDGRPSHQTGQSHPMGERSIGERSWWKVSRRRIFHRFSGMRGGHRSGLASCFPLSRTALNHIK